MVYKKHSTNTHDIELHQQTRQSFIYDARQRTTHDGDARSPTPMGGPMGAPMGGPMGGPIIGPMGRSMGGQFAHVWEGYRSEFELLFTHLGTSF